MTEEANAGHTSVGQASVTETVGQPADQSYNEAYNKAYNEAYNKYMSSNESYPHDEVRPHDAAQPHDEVRPSKYLDYRNDVVEGYDPNEFLDENLRDARYSRHRDFNGVVRELKNDYATLKKGFDGKVENWTPEIIEGLAEKIRGTAFGIPNDPSGYESMSEEDLDELTRKYDASFKNKGEREDFWTALKTGAYLNGVPKDKLGTFAETYLAIKRGAFEDASARIQEFYEKQEKETVKSWGDRAESNKAMTYQYLNSILPKAHPDGEAAGKRAADVLVRSGAIKNKDVANLFLQIMGDYFPKPANVPANTAMRSHASVSQFGRTSVGNMSQITK